MRILRNGVLAGRMALLAGLAASANLGAQEADLVLVNGTIWTVDEENPRAEAVASVGEEIVYVGDSEGVQRHIGASTRVIDLDGALVTPGFNDNHVHFAGTGALLYGLNLLDISDENGLVARIRDVHERYTAGTWITGGDWSAYETWSEGAVAEAGREVNPDDLYGNLFLPNKEMIDPVTGDRPVLIRRFDRKVYLANSAALEAAGITAATGDPDGIMVERCADREPARAAFSKTVTRCPARLSRPCWYGTTYGRSTGTLFRRRHASSAFRRP